jgi:broad specificity phosphatase PhoE
LSTVKFVRRVVVGCSLAAAVFFATAIAADPPLVETPAPTIILIVRHAEKVGQTDSLSTAGVTRAQELARVLQAANVRAIYHSDTKRTRDTATPLADALHIKPEQYPAKDVKALIERILRDHAGQTVLVVGHSNTVPMIVAAAGGPTITDLADGEFDELFVVYVSSGRGSATLTRLEYGAPSP